MVERPLPCITSPLPFQISRPASDGAASTSADPSPLQYGWQRNGTPPLHHPGRERLDVGKRLARRGELGDADGEHLRLAAGDRRPAGELARRDDYEPVVPARRDVPVVADGEDVEVRAGVVLAHRRRLGGGWDHIR
jgi:hypothetical protein